MSYRPPSNNDNRKASRRPSFILVDKNEEDGQVSSSTVISSTGIPALYILAGATTLIGIIAMAVITKYWTTTVLPPTCLLYAPTASNTDAYHFGTSLSCCYWVTYGAIPALLICIVCAIIYILHVKDDKEITFITYGCVLAMSVGTVVMLAVSCTLSQGLRITCANMMINASHNQGKSCQQLLDARVDGFNLPVNTSTMITAALITYWISTFSFIIITIFHIALLVRRTSAY